MSVKTLPQNRWAPSAVLCMLGWRRLGKQTGKVRGSDLLEGLLETFLGPSGVTKQSPLTTAVTMKTARHTALVLPSRPLPLGSSLGPIDPPAVTLQLVCSLLVAGNVHQLQVLSSEEQAVEVLPVHLPPILDCFSQRGHHGALLLNSAKAGETTHLLSGPHTTGCCALSRQPRLLIAQCLP